MSAPSPAPAPAPTLVDSLTWGNLLRWLGTIAVVAVVAVAVWQGFGAAGYGTDAHTHRVIWVCIQSMFCALGLLWMRGLSVRVIMVLIGLGTACGVWWTVRTEGATGRSLAEAVALRDRYRAQLATAEDPEQTEGLKGIDSLATEYPSLAAGLSEDYERWKAATADEIVARYGRTPPEDVQAGAALRKSIEALNKVHPKDRDRLDGASREWLDRAVKARAEELSGVWDWAGFDRTAPGRKALAEAFPEARSGLMTAEDEWVQMMAFRWVIPRGLPPAVPRSPFAPLGTTDGRAVEKDILALNSLDRTGERFRSARQSLFVAAHEDTKELIAAHHKAGRYAAAFGLARKHAVDWNAPATVLGEVKKLDELRNRCEALAKLHENDPEPTEPVEIAPAPRPRPEK